LAGGRIPAVIQSFGDTMSDKFRKKYRELTDPELKALDGVKAAAELYDEAIQKFVQPGRYMALANTALEESVMWAVKSITG
jgi:hypothetical protein